MLRMWMTGTFLLLFLFTGQTYLYAEPSIPTSEESFQAIHKKNDAQAAEIDELKKHLEVTRLEAEQRRDEISNNALIDQSFVVGYVPKTSFGSGSKTACHPSAPRTG